MKLEIFGRGNKATRATWLKDRVGDIHAGLRILDAGAGELRNAPICKHLVYVSQDICEYKGDGNSRGLQTGSWNTKNIDIISDICSIPEPDASFDAILCSEVLEHIPDPIRAIAEFARLLKSDGTLIITAPFCSLTHFAPFHYSSGFNRYWYEFHLPAAGFRVVELVSNGNWFEYVSQELFRLPKVAKTYSSSTGGWLALIISLPLIMVLAALGSRIDRGSDELLNFGWHLVAKKVDLEALNIGGVQRLPDSNRNVNQS